MLEINVLAARLPCSYGRQSGFILKSCEWVGQGKIFTENIETLMGWCLMQQQTFKKYPLQIFSSWLWDTIPCSPHFNTTISLKSQIQVWGSLPFPLTAVQGPGHSFLGLCYGLDLRVSEARIPAWCSREVVKSLSHQGRALQRHCRDSSLFSFMVQPRGEWFRSTVCSHHMCHQRSKAVRSTHMDWWDLWSVSKTTLFSL